MKTQFPWRLSICLIYVINVLQIELERLNTATDDINKLEVDLDVSRSWIKLIDNNITLLMFKKKYLNTYIIFIVWVLIFPAVVGAAALVVLLVVV
jgi:hypothetical protein